MDIQFESIITTPSIPYLSQGENHYQIAIYSDLGYTGSVTHLDVVNASITRQNSDVFDNIISSGFKIEFINNIPADQLSSLQNNYDKAFLCTVINLDTYTTLFRGYLAQDIIEVSLEHQDIISLEFSDYLKKLEDYTSLLVNGDMANVGNLLTDSINLCGISQPFIINNSLKSSRTTSSTTNCFLKDIYIDTNNLLDDTTADSSKDVVNKLLAPFNSYLYSFNDSYYIEAYRDLFCNTSWVNRGTGGAYSAVASKAINLTENVDFVIERGSKLNYESGVKTYTLNLKQKLYNNLLYNNFSNYLTVAPTFPDLPFGKWGANLGDDENPKHFGVGYGYYNMGIYYIYRNQLMFDYQNAHYTTIYNFNYLMGKKATITLDKSENPQNQLSINATVGKFTEFAYDKDQVYSLNYIVKIASGVNAGKFIGVDSSGKAQLYLPSTENRIYWYRSATGTFKAYQNTVDVNDTLNLSNLIDPNGDGLCTDSIFGDENDVDIIIYFTTYFLLSKAGNTSGLQGVQRVGNVVAKYSSALEDNTLIGDIDADFSKQMNSSIYFFDTANCNYSNALFDKNDSETTYTRTNTWLSSVYDSTLLPLATRLLSNLFSFYGSTKKKFIGNVITHKIIKPLTGLTVNGVKYFVTKDIHNITTDIHQIEGYEYNNEIINLV